MTVLASLTLLEKHIPEDREDRRLLRNAAARRPQRRGADSGTAGLFPSPRAEAPISGYRRPRERYGNAAQVRAGTRHGASLPFSAALPLAWVDPNRLELALLNAALTARETMPNGGRLVISACEDGEAASSPLAPGRSGSHQDRRHRAVHEGRRSDRGHHRGDRGAASRHPAFRPEGRRCWSESGPQRHLARTASSARSREDAPSYDRYRGCSHGSGF